MAAEQQDCPPPRSLGLTLFPACSHEDLTPPSSLCEFRLEDNPGETSRTRWTPNLTGTSQVEKAGKMVYRPVRGER